MKKALRLLIYTVYLTLTGISVVFLAADFAGRSPLAGIGMLALCCSVGYAASGFVKERRALVSLLAALVLAAATIFLLPYGGWNVLLAVLFSVAAILAARHDWAEPDTQLIDARLLPAGLVACALTYLIALINLCETAKPQIGYALYGYLVLSVLLINRKSVRDNAGGQAGRMMRGNQALAWGFAAVLTLAVFFRPLQSAVWNGLRGLIAAMLSLFDGKPSSSQTVTSGRPADQLDFSALGGQDRTMPPWLETLGNVLLYAVTVVALIALAAFLVWALWKGLRQLRAALVRWLHSFGSTAGEDYSEESEQLMTAQSMTRQLRDDMKRRARRLFTPPPRWSALTPVQRVRAVYQHLLEQQKRVAPTAVNLTPEELCARAEKDAAFARLYDRARYSDQPVDGQEAEAFRSYLRS